MKTGLRRLFRPRSIAVIGGGSWCENVIRQAQAFGFQGDIWPVHPKRAKVAGVDAFRSIEDLPGVPDASFIGINRNATISTVRALNKLGAGGAVCFASGFSEAEAEDRASVELQVELLEAAGDMPLIGPNCYGFINALDGALLWPDQHGTVRCETGVAIITQSSNIAINLTMQRRGLPLAYVVTAGNQAQTGLAEIGMELLNDARVTALGLHVEGVGDGAALAKLVVLARAAGKPIVVLKVGKSEQARVATISHTASLAGSAAGADAVLKRFGLPQVASLTEFVEALKLLHLTGGLASNRIASMSCSGGEASLMADQAAPNGVVFPELSDKQLVGLRDSLGPMVKLANPLDYHTYIWNDQAAMEKTYLAMVQGDLGLAILVADFPRSDRCDSRDWDFLLGAFEKVKTKTDIPLAIASSLPENLPEGVAERLFKSGIVPLCGLGEALAAARVGVQWCDSPSVKPAILPPIVPNNCVTLGEAQAKGCLSNYGLCCPVSRRVEGISELKTALRHLTFPVVLKGEGVAHKTEAGAVVLNLVDSDQVVAAALGITGNWFLVEEMVTEVVCELLVGIVLDPAHGYVLTIGAGGMLAELMGDTVSLMVPETREGIQEALEGLKIQAMIQGYRGQPGADQAAIIDAILALQDYVVDHHGHVEEVEINPLLCLQNSAIAADALIRIGELND